MFIPCTIVLTEKEYTILQELLKLSGRDDKDLSLAVRHIIQEWERIRPPDDTIPVKARP